MKRFVSAFWYVHNIINTDTSKLDINNLSLDNCLAPPRIRYKMTHKFVYSKEYDYLINYFKNPNELAECLTSSNCEKKKAIMLMNHPEEHIYKGIGWYLHNGDFIKNNSNSILFVGTTENMENDIIKLSNILKEDYSITNNKIRKNKNNNDKYLSKLAIQNLLDFYKNTDYKALKTLLDYNFISEELFKEYHTY